LERGTSGFVPGWNQPAKVIGAELETMSSRRFDFRRKRMTPFDRLRESAPQRGSLM
jgi:hypothetical protein